EGQKEQRRDRTRADAPPSSRIRISRRWIGRDWRRAIDRIGHPPMIARDGTLYPSPENALHGFGEAPDGTGIEPMPPTTPAHASRPPACSNAFCGSAEA